MYNELKTNIVQIEIDNGSGFCFGVTTAIKKAEEELAKGGKLYCLGDIVHNGMEVERLHEAGLITIDHEQMEELQGVKVLLRAHGEPPETYALAERNNIEIIDATCPVVLQLQRRIKKQYVNNPEAQIVIFGKNGHAEVLGLVGQTESHAIVVEKFEDVKQLKETGQLDFSKDIYLYSQTTKSLDEFHRIIEYCQEHIVEGAVFKSFDTICRQVANRMPNIAAFASKHDVILFVSGRKSSNGKVLFKECKSVNANSYQIENADELLAQMPADPQCADIVTRAGAKDTYYYSNANMSDNYAMIAQLIEDKDLCVMFAEMVRFNARIYPSATPLKYFQRSPYGLAPEVIEQTWKAMQENPAYADIEELTNNQNERFLFSTKHLTRRYAKAISDVDDFCD